MCSFYIMDTVNGCVSQGSNAQTTLNYYKHQGILSSGFMFTHLEGPEKWALDWAFRNDKQNNPAELAHPRTCWACHNQEAGEYSVPTAGSGITRIGKLPSRVSVLGMLVWNLWIGSQYLYCWLQSPPCLVCCAARWILCHCPPKWPSTAVSSYMSAPGW